MGRSATALSESAQNYTISRAELILGGDVRSMPRRWCLCGMAASEWLTLEASSSMDPMCIEAAAPGLCSQGQYFIMTFSREREFQHQHSRTLFVTSAAYLALQLRS